MAGTLLKNAGPTALASLKNAFFLKLENLLANFEKLYIRVVIKYMMSKLLTYTIR